MPRLPINYQNTIIYKIVCRDLAITNCYVGHTTDFTNRKRSHKCACNTNSRYVYQFIRENGDWDNWDMIMIEQYPCKDIYEASARERYWIEQLNANLNQRVPYTGLSLVEAHKQWRTENADIIRKKKKEEWIKNRDIHLEKQKQYRTENADKIRESLRLNYIKTADKRAEHSATQFCCILCHKQMRRDNFNRHYRAIHNIST